MIVSHADRQRQRRLLLLCENGYPYIYTSVYTYLYMLAPLAQHETALLGGRAIGEAADVLCVRF